MEYKRSARHKVIARLTSLVLAVATIFLIMYGIKKSMDSTQYGYVNSGNGYLGYSILFVIVFVICVFLCVSGYVHTFRTRHGILMCRIYSKGRGNRTYRRYLKFDNITKVHSVHRTLFYIIIVCDVHTFSYDLQELSRIMSPACMNELIQMKEHTYLDAERENMIYNNSSGTNRRGVIIVRRQLDDERAFIDDLKSL